MQFVTTRRLHRRIFRRLRIYLPLLAVMLLSMVLFLPISAPWLASTASSRVSERLGVDVGIDRLEVTAAFGYVEAFGITIPSAGPGGQPFRVGRAEFDGQLNGLLAGGEKWPDRVVLDKLPTLEIRRAEGGTYEFGGAYQTLIQTLQNLKTASASKPSGNGAGVGRLPNVLIRGLSIQIESPLAGGEPIRIHIDQAELLERPSSQSPLQIELRGKVTARGSEDAFLRVLFFPEDNRLTLRGSLSGITVPFQIPSLGAFEATGRSLSLDGSLEATPEGRYHADLSLKSDRMEIRRNRVGGERWDDTNIDLGVDLDFNPETLELLVHRLELKGNEVDFGSSGRVVLAGDLEGESSVVVKRLPLAALRMGANELTERLGIVVETANTSPTLDFEVAARGPFALPQQLDYESSIRLSGWQVRLRGLPEPIVCQDFELVGSPANLQLKNLELTYGSVWLRAESRLALAAPGAPPTTSTIDISLRGNAEDAVSLLARGQLLPAEIQTAKAPVSVDLSVPVHAYFDENAQFGYEVISEYIRATVSWRSGEIGLRSFAEPIRLGPGEILYANRQISAERLRLFIRDLDLSLTGTVQEDLFEGKFLSAPFSARLNTSGELPKLLAVIGSQVTLPDLPRDLAGNYQLEVRVDGSTDHLEELDYQLTLLLDKVALSAPIPYRSVPVKDLHARIVLDRTALEIASAGFQIHDPEAGLSTFGLSARLDDRALIVKAETRSQLELLPLLLPKDLHEIYMSGPVSATGQASLTLQGDLPPGPDLARRWIAFLRQGTPTISVKPGSDLLADFRVNTRQEAPISVFPRDFPVAITNIRGNAEMGPEGLSFRDTRADVGSSKDIYISEALIQFGRPTRVHFTAKTAYLNINEWIDGWSEQEWASSPASFTPRWKSVPEPYQFVEVKARIDAEKIDLLQFTGSNTSSDFLFEAWSRRPPMLRLTNLETDLYGGSGTANVEMTFPFDSRAILLCDATFKDADLNAFVDALLERDQALDGRITGNLGFSGQLLNYPTYAGTGEFHIEESSAVGTLVLSYARELFQSMSETGGRDSVIDGKVAMANEEVHFTELRITHPAMKLASTGYVDFRGRLFFDVAARVLSRSLESIPFINIVGEAIDIVGNRLVTYRVRGKIRTPEVTPVPGILPGLERLSSMLSSEPPPNGVPDVEIGGEATQP